MFAPGQNQLLANLSLLLFLRIFRSFVFMILKRTFEECVSLFSYQRSFCFAVCLKQLCYYIMSFPACQELFSTFWSCFCFSLAATLISYHTQPAVVKNFFHFFLQSFVRRNSFILSRVFSDVKNFFPFLSINAEGGIWTLARRKPSIPLAGAPLQPLEYFCTSPITRWAK